MTRIKTYIGIILCCPDACLYFALNNPVLTNDNVLRQEEGGALCQSVKELCKLARGNM